MATKQENLEKWLLIQALLESDNVSKVKEIADKMVKELESKK